MNNALDNTAILLFARTAEAEARHKTVCPGNDPTANYRVLKTLEDNAFRTAHHSGMSVFHVSELEQHGTTFGARLQSAFEQVFSQGFERVLAIGSDCAQLTGDHLGLAGHQFTQEHLLLGPARDGGVYLLGISRKRFYALDFDGIDWCTDSVFSQLQAIDPNAILLPALSDIDNADDLCRVLLSASVPHKLRNALRALVPGNPAHYGVVQETPITKAEFLSEESRRGPPTSAR